MKLDVVDNERGVVQGFLLVKSCDLKTAKSGSSYLDMMLTDGESAISSKVWGYTGSPDDIPRVNTLIKVRGTINQYNGQDQLKIDRFRGVEPTDDVSLADFVPSCVFTGEQMYNEIMRIISGFSDDNLRRLATAIYEEYKDRIIELPAAFRLHHAIRGGLMMHTLSICRLAQTVIRLYPSVDGDLLLCGAILHDVAKCEEFVVSEAGLVDTYTVEGTLLNHLVRGAMIVDEIGKREGIDAKTLLLVEHMLVSHHGKPEFGASVRPLFLEAEILSALDTLDANIFEIENVVRDVNPGDFTAKMWALDDRKFYNHGRQHVVTDANLFNTKCEGDKK